MPVNPKYKLFAPGAAVSGEKPVCAFFSSPAGCRNGDSCAFLHTTTATTSDNNNNNEKSNKKKSKKNDQCKVAPISDSTTSSSSVLSSESEGEIASPPPTKKKTPKQQQQPKQPKHQQQPESGEKKRKASATDTTNPFANPKKRPSTSVGTAIPSSTIIRVVRSKTTPQQQQQQQPAAKKQRTEKNTPSAVPSFQSMVSGLPIASFSIPGQKSNPSTPVAASNKKQDNSSAKEEENGLPFPNSTAVGRSWQKAVLQSRQHERYAQSFDYGKYQRLQTELGIKAEWVEAKAFGTWCFNNAQAIAIDCEMCETQDPLTGAKDGKALCRFSVVNAENPEEILIDTLVKPAWPVSDYRTRINGIKKEHLENVEFTLRHAQAFMMALCSKETVVVGHAVHNDLVALNMVHHCVADSAFLYQGTDNTSASVSLKDLVKGIFQMEMPDTHDSVNDARKALDCVEHWRTKGGKVDQIERTPKHNGHQLFVHRLPKNCKPEHVSEMFLKHTSIESVEVDYIEFNGEFGKTHVTFRSTRHSHLAFDTLDSPIEEDKSGRLQKKVYLRNGSYVRVRKMVHSRGQRGTPQKETPQK